MADASVPMTGKGHQSLVDELKRLKAVERPKNIRDIEEARAQVIDVSKLSGDKVVFGATVSLADGATGDKVVYQIVGDHEAEPKNGKISISSPIARALIGKSEGDEVQVRTPTGVRTFDILSVEYVD